MVVDTQANGFKYKKNCSILSILVWTGVGIHLRRVELALPMELLTLRVEVEHLLLNLIDNMTPPTTSDSSEVELDVYILKPNMMMLMFDRLSILVGKIVHSGQSHRALLPCKLNLLAPLTGGAVVVSGLSLFGSLG